MDIENLILGLDFEEVRPAGIRIDGSFRGERLPQAAEGFRGMPPRVFYFELRCGFQLRFSLPYCLLGRAGTMCWASQD